MSADWVSTVKATVRIDDAFAALGITRQRDGFGPCPMCGATQRGSDKGRGPLGRNRTSGKWQCWSCNVGGSVIDILSAKRLQQVDLPAGAPQWVELKAACVELRWISDEPESRTVSRQIIRKVAPLVSASVKDTAKVKDPNDAVIATNCASKLWDESGEGRAGLDYLRHVRGFSDATIRFWELGVGRSSDGVLRLSIPLFDIRGDVVNIRFRCIPAPCENKDGLVGCDHCDACAAYTKEHTRYRVLPGRALPLYGSHNLSNDVGVPAIITEGELDVVAYYELGFTNNVVSGTGGAGTLDDDWLDQLEPYAGFMLSHDLDEKGNEAATKWAERLGRYRCSRVTLPRKDAGQCLADMISGDEVEHCVNNSKGMLDTEIVSVGHYADEIERMIANPDDLIGRQTGSALLDAQIGGLRPGLIVVTGESGEGKTSFTTWLLDQQARLGVPSLLTSFEQSPRGTVQKLLRIEIGGDFTKHTEAERRAAMAALEARPLKMVKHRGQMPFTELHDIIRFSVRRYGIKNILIDHLGFIVSPDAKDERKEIEMVMRTLSIIGEHEGVTIFLIVHPSNSAAAQGRRVQLSDCKGASAIRQDAHEGWVVQVAERTKARTWYATYVHVDKSRSEFGARGEVLLAYDPTSTTYADSWSETPSGRRGVMPVLPVRVSQRRQVQAKPGPGPSGRRRPSSAAAAAGAAATTSSYGSTDGDEEG